MNESFPNGGLYIRFISVINTTELGSSLPDTKLFKFPLNPKIMANPTSIM